MTLNDRELATLILFGATVIVCATVPRIRRKLAPSVRTVLQAFFVPRIVAVLGGFLAWTALFVALAWIVGIWNLALLKDTLIIVFGVGVPLLFGIVNAKSGQDIGRQVLRETISLSVFLLFFLNLEPFPLWVELLLIPVAVFVQLLNLVSGRHPEHRAVHRLTTIVLMLIGLALLIWSTAQVVLKAESYDWPLVLQSLALSVLLPVTMLPFLYATAFFSTTEVILVRIRHLGGDSQPARVRLAVVLGLRLSVRLAARFTGRYNGVARTTTFTDARREMRKFRDDVRRRDHEEQQRLDSLRANAGVVGTSNDGTQIDRREFQVTKDRLRWISATQGGRYEGNGRRFWNDLTDIMVDAERHGLPKEHGFVTQTTTDRKKWRCWRRLPSGWVLGIGGTTRGDEYLYQGAEPPSSWPPDNRQWVSAAAADWPSDWQRSDESRL